MANDPRVVCIIAAEVQRCLESRHLNDEQIDELLSAARALMTGPDDEVHRALRELGLAVIRALRARLRREVELRDPRRQVDDGPQKLH